MPRPWRLLATRETPEGALELRQRGDADFLIQVGGRVLMNSTARRSEEELARLGCVRLGASPRVLIGGLGMGYTLRAALDVLPTHASVTVVELNPVVAEWCSGPLSALTRAATSDARVKVQLGDVAQVIAGAAPGSYDTILLDLYEGPHAATQRADDPFYGASALGRARAALSANGVLAVWSEERDIPFEQRFSASGFDVNTHARVRGGAGWNHTIYVGARRE